jgi:hypothetical protein
MRNKTQSRVQNAVQPDRDRRRVTAEQQRILEQEITRLAETVGGRGENKSAFDCWKSYREDLRSREIDPISYKLYRWYLNRLQHSSDGLLTQIRQNSARYFQRRAELELASAECCEETSRSNLSGNTMASSGGPAESASITESDCNSKRLTTSLPAPPEEATRDAAVASRKPPKSERKLMDQTSNGKHAA